MIVQSAAAVLTRDTEGHALRLQRIAREVKLLLLGCVVSALMCLVLWRTASQTATQVQEREQRATLLAVGAERVERLRQQPSQARESMPADGDLLERVAQWMQTASIDKPALVSTSVQPARVVPNSPHAEVVERLIFERVRLEQIARFCHAARNGASELRVTGLQLRAGVEPSTWTVDVSLAYRILAPSRTK